MTAFVNKNKDALIKIVVFGLLLFFSLYLRSFFNIKSYVGDDLGEFYSVKNTPFLAYVFAFQGGRFRPISNIFVYLEFVVCGNDMNAVMLYTLITYTILGFIFYLVASELSHNRLIGFIAAVLFVTSRFSWYNVTQVLGQMENLCLGLLFVIIHFLYKYKDKYEIKYFVLTCVSYALIILSHERYFILIVPLMFYFIFVNKNKLNRLIYPLIILAIFVLYYIVKVYILHISFAVDTGGTEGVSINVVEVLKQSVLSLLNVFELPISKDYLVGKTYDMLGKYEKLLSMFLSFTSAVIMLLALVKIIYNLVKKNYKMSFFNMAIIIAMAFIIGAVSVSARVEMRFLYSAYSLFLLLMSSLFYDLLDLKKLGAVVAILFISIYSLGTLGFNYVMAKASYPYYYIIQDNSGKNYYYDKFINESKEELADKKLVIFVTDKEEIEIIDYWIRQFDLSNGYVLLDTTNIISDLNKYNNEVCYYFNVSTFEIKKIVPETLKLHINESWLEGKINEWLCYSDSGYLYLEYYANEIMANMKYGIYVNGVLFDEFTSELGINKHIYEINSNEYFVLRIECDEPYNASKHGGEDIRDLAMYIINLSMNKGDFDINVTESWTEGLENGYMAYMESGEITLNYRITEHMENMKYYLYADGVLIGTLSPNGVGDFTYTFNDSNLKNKMVYFEIKSDDTYKPRDFGSPDGRDLQMYIINLSIK